MAPLRPEVTSAPFLRLSPSSLVLAAYSALRPRRSRRAPPPTCSGTTCSALRSRRPNTRAAPGRIGPFLRLGRSSLTPAASSSDATTVSSCSTPMRANPSCSTSRAHPCRSPSPVLLLLRASVAQLLLLPRSSSSLSLPATGPPQRIDGPAPPPPPIELVPVSPLSSSRHTSHRPVAEDEASELRRTVIYCIK
jgi:hypothetical protein